MTAERAIDRTLAYQRHLREAGAPGSESAGPAVPRKEMTLTVWVCPTPGCDDYYGATGCGDLAASHTGPKTEDRHTVPTSESRVGRYGFRHSRAECPTCRARGLFVDRVRTLVAVSVPAAGEGT